MTIRELRTSKRITQQQAAQIVGIPLRTYCRYEAGERGTDTIKYAHIMSALSNYGYIDEEHGILELNDIKELINKVLSEYDAEYCYLFGSYAKGTANETSDIDLLISTTLTGMNYFGLVEKLREALKKKIDLFSLEQLSDNTDMINEVLKDGIKIYG